MKAILSYYISLPNTTHLLIGVLLIALAALISVLVFEHHHIVIDYLAKLDMYELKADEFVDRYQRNHPHGNRLFGI